MANTTVYAPRIDQSVSTFIKAISATNTVKIFPNNDSGILHITVADAVTSKVLMKEEIALTSNAVVTWAIPASLWSLVEGTILLPENGLVQIRAQVQVDQSYSSKSSSLLAHFVNPMRLQFEGGEEEVTVDGDTLNGDTVLNTFLLAGDKYYYYYGFSSFGPGFLLEGTLVDDKSGLAPEDDLLWVQLQGDFATEKIVVTKKNTFALPLVYEEETEEEEEEEEEPYQFEIWYGTVGGYVDSVSCELTVATPTYEVGTQDIYVNNELGAVRVTSNWSSITSTLVPPFCLQRCSGRSYFKTWENITSFTPADAQTEFTYVDTSVEPGVAYKYRLRDSGNTIFCLPTQVDASGAEIEMTASVDTESSVFLTTFDRQLKLKYNVTIGSYNRKSTSAVSGTLGGRYPSYSRNGQEDYRTFTLGGMIAYECEEDRGIWFNIKTGSTMLEAPGELERITANDSRTLLGVQASPYSLAFQHAKTGLNETPAYLMNRQVDGDWALREKFFREQVVDYLMRNQMFLFRSYTEGNMIVVLSNISLTPNAQLGRNIYSFSAQVTEVKDTSCYDSISLLFKEQETSYGVVTSQNYARVEDYGL